MMDASTCPQCGSKNLRLEKSPDGLTTCHDCGHSKRHTDWYLEHTQKELDFLRSRTPEHTQYFKSKADIWNFLLKGGAITNLDESCSVYVYLKEGNPVFNTGEKATHNFDNPEEWSPYHQWKLVKELHQYKEDNPPDPKIYLLRKSYGDNFFEYVKLNKHDPNNILAWVIPSWATRMTKCDAEFLLGLWSQYDLEIVNSKEIFLT